MRKSLLLMCLMVSLLSMLFSCRYERIYYHSKTGHYRSAKVRKNLPWFNSGEKGYNKAARHTIHRWDRNFR